MNCSEAKVDASALRRGQLQRQDMTNLTYAANTLSKAPILIDWYSAMQRETEHRLLAGRNIPGQKLVEKRPTRKWADEEKLVAFLKEKGLFDEEIYQQKLKSPAQIEKLVGKKELPADLVVKKSSGYKLAPSSDPSPAIAAGPQVAFAALPPVAE